MSDGIELWELPDTQDVIMLAGWRQWADGGSVSSLLPQYLIDRLEAHQIGRLDPEGYYLFQFPGTHDLIRPVVQFKDGYPQALVTPENVFYYVEYQGRGIVIFIGDEPHLNVEAYVQSFLQAARRLHVKRIIGLGGVYGEFPYEKERGVSANYSLRRLKQQMKPLAVQLSNYQGGASIGSYVCRRAGERRMEYIGLYALVPMFNIENEGQPAHRLQLEQDHMAWLAIMRRIDYMFKLGLDLSDLEDKARAEIDEINQRIDELEKLAPQLGLREYFARISADFVETPFIPLDDVWEENLRRILDKMDDEDEETQ